MILQIVQGAPPLQDSLRAARDSARVLLERGGVDTRYWLEAWFFLGLAATILGWVWRTYREAQGEPGAGGGGRAAAAWAAAPGEGDRAPGPDSILCPAPSCGAVLGDARTPIGYLSVCRACGSLLSVALAGDRPVVRLREGS